MELNSAVTRCLSKNISPVISDYELSVIFFNFLKNKKFLGEIIDVPPNIRPVLKHIRKKVILPLEKFGILIPHNDFPYGRVFQILGKPQNAEEIACSIDPFAYISHLSAMAFHGLTNRLPKIIYISTSPFKNWVTSAKEKMKKDFGEYLDEYLNSDLPKLTKIRFEIIEKNRIIKYASIRHGAFKHIEGRALRVSTIGRTFLDMLRKPEYCGGMSHVIEIFTKHAEQYSKLIIEEIDRHGKTIEKVRAGYLLEEFCHIEDQRINEWVKYAQQGGSRKLDPTKEYREVYSSRWCLSLNVD
jgi:predicted transcriptional regulator of viral defense system